MPLTDDKVAVNAAVQAMFEKQAAINPDPEMLGQEQPIIVSKMHEYTAAEDAAQHILQNNAGGSKARIIIVSYATRKADRKPVFYVKKGRINTNGSAQVGRTWDLLSLNGMSAPNPQGPLLIVTFQKPYFWVFDSAKDRQDFWSVASDAFNRASTLQKTQIQQQQLMEQQRQQQALQAQQLQQQHLQTQQQQLDERARKEQKERNLREHEERARWREQQDMLQQERLRQEQMEQERIRQEQIEAEQHKERLEQERLQHERLERERLEQERYHQKRIEQERFEQERLEQEHLEQQQLEQERVRQERTQTERLQQEQFQRKQRALHDQTQQEQAREGRTTNENVQPLSTDSLPPPVPEVSRRRTVSRNYADVENDELNQTSFEAPVPPPHGSIESVAPLQTKKSISKFQRTPSRSYKPPIHPEEIPTKQNLEPSLKPSPSFDKANSQRDSFDTLNRPVSGSQLSPLRSPPRNMRKSPSVDMLMASPTSAPGIRSEVSDLYDVIQDAKSPTLDVLELERSIKNRLDSLSEQTCSSVINVDRYLENVDNLVTTAIKECDSVDARLQGVALELFGKSDDRHIRNLMATDSGFNASRTNLADIVSQDNNGSQVTTLKYRQLAADIEKLLEVSSLDDAFVTELSNFKFVPPNSAQASNQLAFVEGLLIDLSRALEMFDHRATTKPGDSNMMQAFLEPKRTADALATRFGNQFQDFIVALISEVLKPDAALSMLSQPFEQGLEARLLEVFMPYAGCMLFIKEHVPSAHKFILATYEKRVRSIYEQGLSKMLRNWSAQLHNIVGDRKGVVTSKAIQATNVGDQNDHSHHQPDLISLSMPKLKELYGHYARLCDDVSCRVAGQQTFIEQFFFVGSQSNKKLAKYLAASPVPKRLHRVRKIVVSLSELSFSSIDASKSSSWGIENIMQANVFPTLSDTLNRTAIAAVYDNTILECGYLQMLLDLRCQETRPSNQQFLVSVLDKARSQLAERFEKYVGQQTRSILSSTFVTKKRVGVHHRVTQFTKTVSICESGLNEALKLRRGKYVGSETRRLVDRCYANVFRALAQGLKVDASPVGNSGMTHSSNTMSSLAGSVGVGGTDESKEKLNYHVVMIENVYQVMHDLTPLVARDEETTSAQLRRIVSEAQNYYERELHAYISDVVSRPLGKIMVFLAHYDSPKGTSGKPKDTVSSLKRAVKGIDAKELRRDIDQLHKRMEKHFHDADVNVRNMVWDAIREECLSLYTRLVHIAQSVDAMSYIDFSRNDILNAF